MKNVLTLTISLLFALGNAVASFGQTPGHLSADELRQVRLPDVVLESVTPAGEAAVHKPGAHLTVKGVIGGHIQFELLLPEDWNHRFVMGGGGGFVGTVQNMARGYVNSGYATVGTDTGHQSPAGHLAGWAQDNLEAQLNFGYLAVHRTAEVAKALVRAYYHADPEFSYFLGCSRGGGQAMMESQRYPRDFDGIVAGAPAFNWPGLAATMVEIAQALYPDPNHLDSTPLTRDALQTLHDAILDQCDAQDGLKDGIIQNPPATHFDLARVTNLTDAQRRCIEAIYRGARNDQVQIYPGFAPVVECDPDQWIAWLVGPVPAFVSRDHVPDLSFAFGTQIFKYLIFNDPTWDYASYRFDHFDRTTHLAASFLNATNPNLDLFKARKGRLILWHGWADPALPAEGTIEYYRQVLAHDPDAAAYCRLFLIPGCFHCGGGPGPSEVDWLALIRDWVEQGNAPDQVLVAKTDHGAPIMTRPLYPFPEHAIYNGTGDSNRADSFHRGQ